MRLECGRSSYRLGVSARHDGGMWRNRKAVAAATALQKPPAQPFSGQLLAAWAGLDRPFGARIAGSNACTLRVQQKLWDTLNSDEEGVAR
jgi:hypothetical protein